MESNGDVHIRNVDEKPLLVELKGRLYDVAKFANRHPGGAKVLRRAAGEVIDDLMTGEKRALGVKHQHSEAAYRILSHYAVDGKEPGVKDLIAVEKPVLKQIGHLHHNYWTWIHQPVDMDLRLFESDYLELFTRTKWFVIPLIWMPMVMCIGFQGLQQLSSIYGLAFGLGVWALLFGLGSLIWSLTEYVLHRFVFHWQPNADSDWQIVLHFLLHGLHHKTPMDGGRLVFPPLPAIPIVGFFYLLYSTVLPWPVFCAFGPGKLFGYICYDMIHYYLHHGHPPAGSTYHYRKVYHHNHHFKDGDTAYGISTNLWDYVFGTVGMGPL